MAVSKSAGEVEREHISAMGPNLGPLYNALYDEVTWLHAKWLEYRKLYARTPERIILLNESAGFLFGVLQKVLWDDVLLHIARLTDPPRQRKFDNLTIHRLPALVTDLKLAREIQDVLNNLQGNSAFARDWRNRRIAHRDLRLALETQSVEPLSRASRQHVENVLTDLRKIMNLLQAKYLDGEVAFEHFFAQGDADALVYHLSRSKKTLKEMENRLRSGRPLPSDFENLPEV